MIDKGFKKWKSKLNRSSVTSMDTNDSVFNLAGYLTKQTCTIVTKSLTKAIWTLKKVKGFLTTGLRTKKTLVNVNGL